MNKVLCQPVLCIFFSHLKLKKGRYLFPIIQYKIAMNRDEKKVGTTDEFETSSWN